MATSKKKSETFLDRDKHTLEFTPAQLMGAIITLLVFGTACFLLGIVVNKVDNARGDRAPEVASAEAAAPAEPEGTQTTPRVDASTTGEAEASKAKLPRTVTVPPKKKELRQVPLPSQQPATEPEPEPAATVAKADPPVVTPPENVDAAPAPAESAEVEPVKPEAADVPVESATAPPEQMAELDPFEAETITEAATAAAATPDTSAPANGKYAIQVISFSTANRKQADEFIALMSKQTDLSPRIVESKDGKHLRVVVGSFADRASADEKRKELAQIKQFQDCFVQALP